jgi:NitT/TauT family transport system ATP-binding protein
MAGKQQDSATPAPGPPPSTTPARIELNGLTKRYITPTGQAFTAIQDVTFTVEPGQFCAIVGPTGCGKTTTLGQVSGLERASAGSVTVGGQLVNGVTTGVSFMFQADALFPWKTVLGNVMIGPILNGSSKAEAVSLAQDWLRRVGLAGFEDRYPHQLSGGMRKRVAMAAALINEPKILLMDEPFGALDVQTRLGMQNLINEIWEEIEGTILFVTHDIAEAVYLADKIHILSAGPGTFVDEIEVDLPVHREEELKQTKRFRELETLVLERIRAQAKGGNVRITT